MTLDPAQRRALETAVDRAPSARLRWTGQGTPSLVANTEAHARPAAVVTCADIDDWPALVAVTAEAGIPVAIRGGGWSPGGVGTVDGGVVLSLAETARITPLGGDRFRIQGGALTGAVSAALDERGLAMTLPVPSEPGFIGAALSGGVGFTFRRDGLICDAMESAVLVTVAGDRIEVDDESDPDAMWALRGAGSNLGMVTEAVFGARAQGPLHVVQQIIGLDHASEVLAWYEAWTSELTSDVTSVIMLRNAPQVPGLPASAVDRPALVMSTVHAGDEASAARDLAPLGDLPGVLFARSFAPTLHELRLVTDATFRHQTFGIRTASGWSDGLTADAAESIAALAVSMPPGETLVEVAALGGSIAEPRRPSAAAGRDRRHLLNAMAIWAEPTQRDDHLAWFEQSRQVIRRWRAGDGLAPSFADLEEVGVPASYGVADVRLAEVKRRFDPANHFSRNVNVDTTTKEKARA